MRNDFEIAGFSVRPGTRQDVSIRLPALHSDTPMSLPVHVIHGRRDGPVLCLSAAIHGDEINGIEVIRRLLTLSGVNKIRGTLLAVPMVNVYGFENHSRYLPDRRDLNRSFPGREQGTLAGRLAYTFLHEVVLKSDIGIDLHTAAIHRDNFPQIRADIGNPMLRRLARVFESPVLLHSAPPEGSLRFAAAAESIPIMVYEAGEALRYDEVSIRVAVRGVLNVMRELEMLPKSRRKKTKPPVVLRSSSWARAPRSGVMRALVKLGDMVAKGDTMAVISTPFSGEERVLAAHSDGIIIGRTNLPLVYEGEALFHIGRSHQSSLLEEHLDVLQDDTALTSPELVEEPAIV